MPVKKKTVLQYIEHHSRIHQVSRISPAVLGRVRVCSVRDRLSGRVMTPAEFQDNARGISDRCMVFDDGASPVAVFPLHDGPGRAELKKIRNEVMEVAYVAAAEGKTTETRVLVSSQLLAEFHSTPDRELQRQQKTGRSMPNRRMKSGDHTTLKPALVGEDMIVKTANLLVEILARFDSGKPVKGLTTLSESFRAKSFTVPAMIDAGLMSCEAGVYSLAAPAAKLEVWRSARPGSPDEAFKAIVMDIIERASMKRRSTDKKAADGKAEQQPDQPHKKDILFEPAGDDTLCWCGERHDREMPYWKRLQDLAYEFRDVDHLSHIKDPARIAKAFESLKRMRKAVDTGLNSLWNAKPNEKQ